MTPLAVAAGVVVLLLLPNLVMHTGLRSQASPNMSLLGNGAASHNAAAAVQSSPVMR